jgi:mercuric ion binding protein
MVRWMFFLVMAFLVGQVVAQKPVWERASVEVPGNCGMCKKKIESAAKADGVKEAKWNQKTKILDLKFNPAVISLDQIQLRIAAAGYDTPKFRANDETYEALHECCHYPRK